MAESITHLDPLLAVGSGSTEEEEGFYFAAKDREQLINQVNDELLLYKRLGNGLALWRAYLLCREAGEPVPEVILLYIDTMAGALTRASNTKAVAAAVQMEGRGYGGSARKHMVEADRTYHLVSQVHLLVSMPRPLSMRDACRRVANARGLKWESLKTMYLRWRRPQRNQARPAHSVFEWGQNSGE